MSKHNKEGERTKGNRIKSQSGKYHVISHSFRHEMLEVNVFGASWRLNCLREKEGRRGKKCRVRGQRVMYSECIMDLQENDLAALYNKT